MKLIICFFCVVLICVTATGASAGVVYEFVESGTGNVLGTLNFMDSTASTTSAWQAPSAALSTLLEGGISGFFWDFGSGLEIATGGDLPIAIPGFMSIDGSELDAGFYLSVFPIQTVNFPSGVVEHITARQNAADNVSASNVSFSGSWQLASTSSDVITVITVDIDIKPGDNPNCLNNNGKGVIPVAILGSEAFNVTQVDVATVMLAGLAVNRTGKKGKLQAHIDDVNSDTFADLVLQIKDEAGVFSKDDTTAKVTGNLLTEFGGNAFEGTDSICIVGRHSAAPGHAKRRLKMKWASFKVQR